MAEGKNQAWQEFLIDFTVALIVGVATFFAAQGLGGAAGDLAGILGIVASLVTIVLTFCARSFKVVRERSSELARRQDELLTAQNGVLQTIRTETSAARAGAEEQQGRLLRAISDYSAGRKFGLLRIIDQLGLQIAPDNVPGVWRQLLWDVHDEYLATNYIRDIYDLPWAEAALAIQAAKVQEHLTIRKVFIVDDRRELRRNLDLFHRQQSAGIAAKYLLKEQLASNDVLAGKMARVHGQLDFGVFDQRFVLRWDLTPEVRTVSGGAILTEQPTVGNFRQAFEALFEAAEELPPRLEVRPLLARDRAEVAHWPPYPALFQELNYAIDANDGWLKHQGEIPGTIILGGHRAGRLVAFSLLVPREHGCFEFYVAVRASDLNNGLGREMTRRTVRYGFEQCGMDRIWLKVRANHAVGKKLYREEGFLPCGTKHETIMGHSVEFELMEQYNTPAG